MGKINQGLLGGVSGKVGNVIGGSWKGTNYLRIKPASVANPKTAAQQTQRGKFGEIVADARLLLAGLIQTYWDPFAQRVSGFNRFISANINAYSENGLSTFTDFSASLGTLIGFDTAGITVSNSGSTVTLEWTDNSGKGDALATDELKILVYNETQDYWLFEDTTTQRSSSPADFDDSQAEAGDSYKVWAFFSRPDVSKVSNSVLSEVEFS